MVRAATWKGWFIFVGLHSFTALLGIPGFFFIFVYLSKKVSGNREISLKKIFTNFSYTLVPVGLGIWMAFSVGIILPNGSYLMHILSDPFAWGWNLLGTAGFPWIPVFNNLMGYIQGIVLLIFYLLSLAFGFRLSKQTYPELTQAKRGWIPILVFLTIITGTFLWLFLG